VTYASAKVSFTFAITIALPSLPLPLPNQPPDANAYRSEGYDDSEDGDRVETALTNAFETGIDRRDTFLGLRRCIICGMCSDVVLRRCHIVGEGEQQTWSDLRKRGWIPSQTTEEPRHDLRNGLLLCCNYHILFNGYHFFVRFLPAVKFFDHFQSPSIFTRKTDSEVCVRQLFW